MPKNPMTKNPMTKNRSPLGALVLVSLTSAWIALSSLADTSLGVTIGRNNSLVTSGKLSIDGNSFVATTTTNLEIWASDSLTKVMRSAAPPHEGAARLELSGARGEIVSGQAVLRPGRDVVGAGARMTELRHCDSAAVIPASAVKLQWVRYIDVTRNSSDVPENELLFKAPASVPDPYWEHPNIPVKSGHAQPVWIEIHVPRDALAGDYEGKLSVTADGQTVELPVSLRVWGFEMSAERHLSVINWWRFPGDRAHHQPDGDLPVINWWRLPGDESPGHDEDWSQLRKACEFLVEHRQTDVNVEIEMIKEGGDVEKDGSWDTGRLERFCETAFAAGIRQIHLHTVGRRTGSILDPMTRIEAKAGAFRRLAAWEQVIQRRGWQRRFAVGIVDEPFVYYEDSYADIVDLVHKTAPSVRCIEAVETEYLGKLDIYVPKLSHLAMWYPQFDQARKEGAELWFYICNHPFGRYPNRWLDQSLLKSRVLFWINYLYDLNGYLHWGFNQYAADPYTQEGISKDLPLGERAIAYPGSNGWIGSLRFSAQRDGIQDYEYLRRLEDSLRQVKTRVGTDAFWLDPRQRSLELCRRVIWSFHDYTRSADVLMQARQAIAEEIEGLREGPLLVIQTSPPEGTVVPAGPRHVNVRGLVDPGAQVTINGQAVKNIRPSGYFCHVYFMPNDSPILSVTVEHEGRRRTTVRRFQVAD